MPKRIPKNPVERLVAASIEYAAATAAVTQAIKSGELSDQERLTIELLNQPFRGRTEPKPSQAAPRTPG